MENRIKLYFRLNWLIMTGQIGKLETGFGKGSAPRKVKNHVFSA